MESSGTKTFLVLAGLCCGAIAQAGVIHPADKLTDDEKIALVRNLSSEYAKVKTVLPRSHKALEFKADGTWDKGAWQQAQIANGPVARLGDKIQITKVTLEGDQIVFEINGGLKDGKRFRDHISVGMGGGMTPVSNSNASATMGTTIELKFPKPMENLSSDDVKKILSPLLDFDERTAVKLYSETLPPEVQAAIAEKRARVGMSRDQVIMALGHPDHKYRESKDGVDLEDWIFGKPPGKITFVTFEGSKVSKVKDQYAGLGIETAQSQPTP